MNLILKKEIQLGGLTCTVYSDGRVYRHPYRTKRGRNMKGKFLAESINHYGYLRVTSGFGESREQQLIHRLVARCFLENQDGKPHVDHINGDKRNNSVDNLRWVTASENGRSFAKKRNGATSKYRGVSLYKRDGNWAAQAYDKDGNRAYLGRFDTELEAAIARDEFVKRNGYADESLNFK